MKKLLFTVALVAPIGFLLPLNAQVKKTTAKTKASAAVSKGPVLNKIDFFNLTPDNAMQALNDELKKIKVILNDIVEEPSYYYDISGNRQQIRSTLRRLYFDNNLTADIIADESDHITAVSFLIGDENVALLKAVKKIMVYNSWPVISQTDNDTTYRNGDKIANSSVFVQKDDEGKITSRSFDVSIKQVSPYSYTPKDNRLFDPQNLSVHDNGDDIGYAIVEFMKTGGINLLYKDNTLPFVMEDRLYSYFCRYYFSNGLSVNINTSMSGKLKNIYIDINDPITFSRLKKSLGVLQWPATQRDKYDESDANYYKLNNVVATVSAYAKDIAFNINPLPEDVSTRLENTFTPSFEDLISLYKSGTKEEVAEAITNSYVTQVTYDKTKQKLVPTVSGSKFSFHFKTPSGSSGSCFFNYNELSGATVKSTEVFLMSTDTAFMADMYRQYLKSSSKAKYHTLLNLGDQYATYPNKFDRVWFMNKEVRDKGIADQQQKEAELAARKERERQEAIEKKRLQNAQSLKTLGTLAEFLLNSDKKQ